MKSATTSYGLDLALFLKLLVMMTIHSAPRAGATAASSSTEVCAFWPCYLSGEYSIFKVFEQAKVDLLLKTWELTNTSKIKALQSKKL